MVCQRQGINLGFPEICYLQSAGYSYILTIASSSFVFSIFLWREDARALSYLVRALGRLQAVRSLHLAQTEYEELRLCWNISLWPVQKESLKAQRGLPASPLCLQGCSLSVHYIFILPNTCKTQSKESVCYLACKDFFLVLFAEVLTIPPCLRA